MGLAPVRCLALTLLYSHEEATNLYKRPRHCGYLYPSGTMSLCNRRKGKFKLLLFHLLRKSYLHSLEFFPKHCFVILYAQVTSINIFYRKRDTKCQLSMNISSSAIC